MDYKDEKVFNIEDVYEEILSAREAREEISMSTREMPKYKCHKEVWALKIENIKQIDSDGNAVITPTDKGFAPFVVRCEYMAKHKPEVGGYYVVYEDGYKSFSPAGVFESGYTRL